jgi:hypothetical protein
MNLDTKINNINLNSSSIEEKMELVHDIQLNFFKDKGYSINSDGLISVKNNINVFNEKEIENIVKCAFEIEKIFKKANSQFGLSTIVGKYAIDKWRTHKKSVLKSEIMTISNSLSSTINSIDIQDDDLSKGEFMTAMILAGYTPKILKKSADDIIVFFNATVLTRLIPK